MWVKIKHLGKPLCFVCLDDLRHLWVDCRPLECMVKDSEWKGINPDGSVRKESQEWYEDSIYTVGIYYKAGDETGLLIEFKTAQEAEESLCNLFRAWSAHRSSIYLIPQGLDWVIESVGRIMERKESLR
jgi:hypothetical protein